MFSLWSKDDEENTENDSESGEDTDNSNKPGRFAYSGPELKVDSPLQCLSPNPLMTRNFYQTKSNSDDFHDRKQKMDDMLQNAWSVRKDVRINTHAVKTSETGGKSFYSRHSTMQGTARQSDVRNGKHLTDSSPTQKTWNIPRTTYSYSENIRQDQYDILGDSDCVQTSATTPHNTASNEEVQRQNIANSMTQGMMAGHTREMSARTKRAQKFQNAYLRSTGMGKYTPQMPKHQQGQDSNDTHKMNWKR